MFDVSGNRVLVIGAGGGFDILTVQIVRDRLQTTNRAVQIDTAGWLNPKFDHFYLEDEGKYRFELPINVLNRTGHVIRFRRKSAQYDCLEHPGMEWYLEHGTRKSIVDDEMRGIVRQPLIHFSTRYGSDTIAKFLATYGTVVLCDVGGDVLYSGQKDNEVQTPLIDAFSLVVLRKAQAISNLEIRVFLLGLGTDGELTANHIEENLGLLVDEAEVLPETLINESDVVALRSYYARIRCKYGGNTIRAILAIWDGRGGGLPLSTVTERDPSAYSTWFNKIISIDFNALCDLNPLSAGDSFSDVSQLAKEHDWVEK